MQLREESGTAVLIGVEDLGPLFGRLFVDHDDPEAFELDEVPERTHRMSTWRVEVPRFPHRLLDRLRTQVDTLGRPLSVRLWGAIEQRHYEGAAYGGFDCTLPRAGGDIVWRLTLRGHGAIRQAVEL